MKGSSGGQKSLHLSSYPDRGELPSGRAHFYGMRAGSQSVARPSKKNSKTEGKMLLFPETHQKPYGKVTI